MDAESKSRGGRWRGASSAAALAVVGALCGAAAWWCAPRLSGAGVVEWGASVAAAEGRYEGSTEAERLVQQGRALEEEAAALKANRPKDAEARYRQAKGVYREAIKADADFVEGYVRLGYAHYALQENAEAEAMLRPLLARWPDSAELRRVYGTVTFSLEGKRAEAVRHLEVAGAREDWFDVQFLLGKHYYETGKLDEAAKAFRLYLAQKPKDIEVHGTLGNIYLKTRKYEPALAEFRYVLSLSPGNVPARINIASIAFRQGKFPEAIRVFEEVLRDSPDQTGVHFNLASSYYQSDDYANALKHYQAFGASRPKHAATRYMSALCLLELGREGEAVAALESTLKVDPKHAKAHWRLGRLALGKGQVKEAKARFERARESDPKLAWPLIDLGRIEREAGRLEEAVRLHAEAVKLEPESAPARDALGRDHFAAGRLEAALAAWREAYALASKGKPKARAKAARVLSVGLLHQGGALLAGGDREGARRCGDEVVGLKEEVAGGRLLLLAVALASGDAKGAEAQLAEAAKASPEHPYVRYGQGRAALERGA